MDDWPTGRLLSTAARVVENSWHEALHELGITHAGLIVLHLLDGGAAQPGDLARQARVQAQTMSRTIERLERDGFVRRIADPTDRRRRTVERTPAGAYVFERSWGIEARLFPEVADVGQLRMSLLTVIRSLERRPAESAISGS